MLGQCLHVGSEHTSQLTQGRPRFRPEIGVRTSRALLPVMNRISENDSTCAATARVVVAHRCRV